MPPEDPTSAPTQTAQLWAELREARAEIARLKAELASVDAASRAEIAANVSLKEQLQVMAQKCEAS